MTIGTIDPLSPTDSPDQVGGGADQLRTLKGDIKASFPGFVTSNNNDVVPTATGPEVEYAAKNFNQARNQDIADNQVAIAVLQADVDAVEAQLVDVVSAIHFGRFLGNGTWDRTPNTDTGNWSVNRVSAGTYTINHSQGTLAPVVSVETTQTGQRVVAMVTNVLNGSFQVVVRNNNDPVDPTAVTFIAL